MPSHDGWARVKERNTMTVNVADGIKDLIASTLGDRHPAYQFDPI